MANTYWMPTLTTKVQCRFENHFPDIVQHRPIAKVADLHAMVQQVFGDLEEFSRMDLDDLCGTKMMQSAILCPLHVTVDYVNALCLASWNGDLHSKRSVDDYLDASDAQLITLETLACSHTIWQSATPTRLEDWNAACPIAQLGGRIDEWNARTATRKLSKRFEVSRP